MISSAQQLEDNVKRDGCYLHNEQLPFDSWLPMMFYVNATRGCHVLISNYLPHLCSSALSLRHPASQQLAALRSQWCLLRNLLFHCEQPCLLSDHHPRPPHHRHNHSNELVKANFQFHRLMFDSVTHNCLCWPVASSLMVREKEKFKWKFMILIKFNLAPPFNYVYSH